jgi:hypothetical protein
MVAFLVNIKILVKDEVYHRTSHEGPYGEQI